MYADDFQQLLPPVACTNASGDEVDWPLLLDPYLKQNGIHICPTDRDARTNSYGLNELAFVDLTDPGSPPQTRVSAFHAPAQTLMMADLGTDNDLRTVRPDTLKMVAPGSDINDDKDARPIARHTTRCDLGWMDGHADALGLDRFYVNQVPTNRSFAP